jgi:alkaline phosphatase D
MQRRYVFLATLIAATAAITAARAQTLYRHPFVGGVTDSSAIVAVWLAADASYTVQYGTDPSLAAPSTSAPVSSTGATDNATKVELKGLMPAARYYYRIATTAGGPVSAIYSFKTFPTIGVDAPVTIFIGSCQQRTAADTGGTFKTAAALGGDLFVQMGDWTYPDERISGFPTREGSVRESYALRLDTTYPFAHDILSQMAVAYVWDDHDFYGNDASGALSLDLRKSLAAAYDRYIPHYPLSSQTGLWQKVSLGNVDIFIIDARSQRDPVDSAFNASGQFAPPPGHSMLAGITDGTADQRAWLLNGIRTSKARWKVIASPVFFNPGAASLIPLAIFAGHPEIAHELADKWIGYPADVDSMKALFTAGYNRNLLMVSGDAHTNAYDDGTHSIVPEFLSANLDIANSSIVSTMKTLGFDVWTAAQPDSLSTVGRIRVETTPQHRLIIESFNETGGHELTFTMTDTSGTSSLVPSEAAARAQVLDAVLADDGRSIRVDCDGAMAAEGSLRLFDVTGRTVMQAPVRFSGTRSTYVQLDERLAAGFYLASITLEGRTVAKVVQIAR